jgi:hypothetical protein
MGFYGDLEDLPLQDILHVIANHGKSGYLTLQTQSHDIQIEFDRGTVSSVTTSDGSLKIGHLLVSQGYVTEEQIERALGLQAMSTDSTRIGEVLIDVGFVTNGEIQEAVNAQLEATIFRILVQPGGKFAFEPSATVSADPTTSGIKLESMVLNALRMADEWGAAFDASHQIGLSDQLIDVSTVDHLTEPEQALVMAVLNGATTLDMIALRSGLSPLEFQTAVQMLQQRELIKLSPIENQQFENVEPTR